ncbi:hypothetical protein IDJ75_00930 [Mucilaginibacter rigui]|uniref:DUF4760 domain-containing protein n=1 Tax=Mucilaginibacter rigui TaxID=534635 RepID=A0ABR7WZQ6_9SPHI|nr:hypothetical protein [Mucilaginibacter rigui]MBD1383826.1 hypothetical protein [Mucilaginibacter rigui]
MEDLITKALNQYFSDFKQYHLLILILFTIVIAVLQITQAIWVSGRIERFKTELKKSEIKFSRFNELQVEALHNIYHKLVNFNYANSNLFYNAYDKNNHNKYKERIQLWVKSYIECINEFSKEKILLSEETKALVKKTLIDFNKVKDAILKEDEDLNNVEEAENGVWELIYDYNDQELEIINKRIEQIKLNDFVKKSEENIKALREDIENHFSKMT